MKRLFCLILMGVLASQNSLSGESQLPQIKEPLNLSYNDFDRYPGLISTIYNIGGDVIVGFISLIVMFLRLPCPWELGEVFPNNSYIF